MPSIESFIQASQKLTAIFGYWPDFHDAEITEVHLDRGGSQPFQKRQPVLTVKLHTWQGTKEVDKHGFYVRRHHTLATLRFHDVDEFSMEGFNQQNVISELLIEQQERTDGPSPFFAVKFWPSYGMGAVFRCVRVEVVDAIPCMETEGVCLIL